MTENEYIKSVGKQVAMLAQKIVDGEISIGDGALAIYDLDIRKLKIFFDRNLNFVREFKLRGVPTTILVNKKGEEFARIIGEVNFVDKDFVKWLSKYD